MAKLPALSCREVIRLLQERGFFVIRQKGSHVFLRHADGRTTVVPDHGSKTITLGTLRAILRETGISPDELHGR